MNIKCIIVDDEPLAREGLENFVTKTPFLEHSASFNSAVKALEYLRTNTIDVMFLDIQMPEMNGIELMKTLKKPPQVIFTTAHREFALEGFELNVTDYLLKPISYDRFLKAVNKISTTDKNNSTGQNYIFIKSDGMIVKIPIKEILYIETAKDYIFIYTLKKRYMTLVSMQQIENILPNSMFIRIHRSFLIATQYVEKIEGNLLYIKGTKISISRRLSAEVYNKIIGKRLIERK